MISKGRGNKSSELLANNGKPATFSSGCKSLGRGASLRRNSTSETINELGRDNVEDERLDNKEQKDTMNEWYYKDPNGFPRGPFSHTEMEEWYKRGYLTDPTLLLKRGCQKEFYSLQDLIIESLFTGDVTPFVFIPPTQREMNFSDNIDEKDNNKVHITPSSILRRRKSATVSGQKSEAMIEKQDKNIVESKEETQRDFENSAVQNIRNAIPSKDEAGKEDGVNNSGDTVKQLLEKVTQLENQLTKLSTAPQQITINDLKALVRDERMLPSASPASPEKKDTGSGPNCSHGLLTRISAAKKYAKDTTVFLPAFKCNINGIQVETILNFELEVNLMGHTTVGKATLETRFNDKLTIIPQILGFKSIINFHHRAYFSSFIHNTKFDNLVAGVVKSWSNKSVQRLWIGNKFMDEYEVRWTPDCKFILFEHPKRGGIYIHGYPFLCRRPKY